jgi:hypothetical protein
VSSSGGPEQPESREARGRRLIWAGGTVVALWFIADGLSGLWPEAGALARVLIAAAAVVVLLVVVLGVVFVVRRDRED